MTRIIVAEYPKSGGVWLVNLIGDSLSLPKRDIYINDDYKVFDVSKHPWFEGSQSFGLTESCIIKSHELPDSLLHNFPAKTIHLFRDGRDVVVSKFFYEKDFCVKNGIYRSFEISFDDYVEKTAAEWGNYVTAWMKKNAITCRYEDLLQNAFSTLKGGFNLLGMAVPDKQIDESIRANTKEKMKKTLDSAFNYNTFIRKGIAGDWRNHFSATNKKIFKKVAGDILIKLRYEKDLDW
jgi:hypothetical protein